MTVLYALVEPHSYQPTQKSAVLSELNRVRDSFEQELKNETTICQVLVLATQGLIFKKTANGNWRR